MSESVHNDQNSLILALTECLANSYETVIQVW